MPANQRLEQQRLVQDLRYARMQARLARHGMDARYWERKVEELLCQLK